MSRSHFQQEAAFWRDVYATPTIESALYGDRQEHIIALVDQFGLAPGARVLEVGCGAGMTAAQLAKRGFQVWGVDFVESMLQMTREHAGEQEVPARLHAVCSDAQALPFPDETFDLAIGSAILEWLASPEQGLAEIARVLKPGGRVVLSAVNVSGLQRLIDPRLSPALEALKRKTATDRARAHSGRELARLLDSAHLQQEVSFTTGYGPFTFFNFKLFPGQRGVRIHYALERMARSGMPLLKDRGYAHVLAAHKPMGQPGGKQNVELN